MRIRRPQAQGRTRGRYVAPLLVLAGSIVAAVGCGSEGAGPTRAAIVQEIRFDAPRSYRYILTNRDREEQGRGTLTVVEDDGNLAFRQAFSDDEGNSDEALLTVDAETLEPIAGRRTIVDEERRSVVDTQYEELDDGSYGVCILQQRYDPPDDDEPSSTRSSPLKVPPNAYDNDSSLWIWRTIRFEQDYTVTYTAVIANRRLKRPVTLRVRRQERIKTPAGEFDAWLVGIESEGQTHDAWFATTPDHKLLVYDNDQTVFLYDGEADPEEFDAPRPVAPSPCDDESDS